MLIIMDLQEIGNAVMCVCLRVCFDNFIYLCVTKSFPSDLSDHVDVDEKMCEMFIPRLKM